MTGFFFKSMSKQLFLFKCGSHIGYKHAINEDAYGAYPELGLWIVADGMGGHNNGSVASRLTVEKIAQSVKAGHSLSVAIQEAHQSILAAGQADPMNAGMGSTVVVLQLKLNHYTIASVGDSRAYLCSKQSLTQITQDHTFVQNLVNQGEITPEQAKIHPYRNILTQALGAESQSEVDIDIFSGALQTGDRLLLCTDGLTNRLQNYKILKLLSETTSLQQATHALIEAALELGGQDNITLILVQLA